MAMVPPDHRTSTVDDDVEEELPPTDFETAMQACGFGIFNILLLLIALLAISSTVLETTAMSYIMPTAECDLHLSLLDKGAINAITYGGMILSAVPWGYIADTMGRKQVLVYGLLVGSVFDLGSACAQNAIQLMILKFFGGVVNCGPFAVIMSYLSEFHSRKHRSRVMMVVGLMKTIALLILPILAFMILPHHIIFHISGLKFHTWQIFVAITALPGLISGSLLSLFPESPKFLMSQGKNADALAAFQTIYAVNTGNAKETYPVKTLFEEAPEKSAKKAARATIDLSTRRSLRDKRHDAKEKFVDGLKQLRPMFSSPYLALSLLVYFMHFCILSGQNSVRLWLPQIFASIVEFEKMHHDTMSMCSILSYNVNKTRLIKNVTDLQNSCDAHITPDSYTNNIIVAACSLFGYTVISYFVNSIGNKNILSVSLAISCICGTSLYWATSEIATLILTAIFVTVSSIAATTVISTSVNVFPTIMRTMVIILIMTFGRLGSLLGNILLPVLMTLGCIPPFVMIGGSTLCACIISLFLPNTTKEALK